MSGENQLPVEILIQIRDELAGLNRARAGLQGATKDATKLGDAIRQGLGIGTGMQIVTSGVALLTNTLRASVGAAFSLATEVENGARAAEMSVEAFQVMKDLIEDTGGSMGNMTMAIKEMREALTSSGKGGGAADAFRTLKINADDFARLPVEEKLETIAKATFNAENRTSAFGAASELLGSRNLPNLTNALRVLAVDGYAKTAAAAKDATQIMGDDTVARLHAAELEIKNFKDSVAVTTGEAIGFWSKMEQSRSTDLLGTYTAYTKAPLYWMGLSNTDYLGQLFNRTIPAKPSAAVKPPAPALASREDTLRASISLQEQDAARISNGVLTTESEKRKELLPILNEQIKLYDELIKTRFGEGGQTPFVKDGDSYIVTEASLAAYRERNELEAKLSEIRQQRLQAVDTPLAKLWREMSDTTSLVNNTLAESTSQAIAGLSSDIWEAAKGTQSWGDAFRNLGNIAGQMLTKIITQMLVVQSINAVLGLFGYGMGGSGGIVKLGTSTGFSADTAGGSLDGSFAGGGSFFTRGPTNIKVGDNPGGVELVSVTPISGIGQTMLKGNQIAMAGGGTALVQGGARSGAASAPVNIAFNFSTGVAATVRAEIATMIPQLRALALDAVQEGYMRNQISLG